MTLSLGFGLGLSRMGLSLGGGGVAPPVSPPEVSGSIATSTIAQGTGNVTVATAQAFTGAGLEYSLFDDLSGRAIPGMSINPVNGVITCNRANLRRGLQYLRVRATNGLGSAELRFNLFVRFEAFDYVASTVAEWNAIWANSDATLAGKVIAWAGQDATLEVPAKNPAQPIIVTTADHTAHMSRVVHNGGGTAAAKAIRYDGARLYRDAYPNNNGIVHSSSNTGNTFVDFVDCDIAHNYRGGPVPVDVPLDEFAKGPTTALTATATAVRYTAPVLRDPAMLEGQVTLRNNGTQAVHFRLGNDTVVANLTNVSGVNIRVDPGSSGNINFSGSYPTHISIISASGSQPVVIQSEQGLANYMAPGFTAGGSSFTVSSFYRTKLHDLANAIKSTSGSIIDDCDIFRVYMDTISTGPNTNQNETRYITRNRIGLPFANSAYAQNPHGDILQMFNESANAGSPIGTNFVFAGNVTYNQGEGDRVQIFLSDYQPGFENHTFIGNANLGAHPTHTLTIGESSVGTYSYDALVFANTLVDVFTPDAAGSFGMDQDPSGARPNYAGFNIARQVGTGLGFQMNIGNVAFTSATADTILVNRPALIASRDFQTARIGYDATVNAGADWAWDNGVIDFNAADHTQVVNWALVPPGIVWQDFLDAPVSTVLTAPWRKTKGVAGTSMAVVPQAGTQWQSATADDGTTIVQDWTASPGTILRGHSIRIRATSAASGNTVSIMGVTINGFAHTAQITTAQASAANFVGRKVYEGNFPMQPRTVDITGLTGGIDTQPREGDLVVVAYVQAGVAARARSITTAGYTTLNIAHQNGTVDALGVVGWKVMGAVPDTQVSVGGDTSSGTPSAILVQVYRGINPVTPVDAQAAGGSTATRVPNPLPVTTTVANTQIVVVGLSAHADATNPVLSSDYLVSQTFAQGNTGGSQRLSAMVGDVNFVGPGVYDPAPLIIAGNVAGDTSGMVTLALRRL